MAAAGGLFSHDHFARQSAADEGDLATFAFTAGDAATIMAEVEDLGLERGTVDAGAGSGHVATGCGRKWARIVADPDRRGLPPLAPAAAVLDDVNQLTWRQPLMQMTPRAGRPRFLLVEDDIISRGFFKAALETLPADVDTADSLASALASAEPGAHDLWLIDVNLPDGNGAQLLRELRRSHPDTPALAHTADGDTSIHARLREAGFSDTLVKPLGRDQLLKAVRRALVNSPAGIAVAPAPAAIELNGQDWDETAALAALNGQRNHLIALRELFLAELPGVRDAVEQAVDQHDERQLRSQLHRLQASCGFVGAARLGRAVRQLHHMPESDLAQAGFRAAVAALLH
jgi:DNA-binding response OmpR family regulator